MHALVGCVRTTHIARDQRYRCLVRRGANERGH